MTVVTSAGSNTIPISYTNSYAGVATPNNSAKTHCTADIYSKTVSSFKTEYNRIYSDNPVPQFGIVLVGY